MIPVERPELSDEEVDIINRAAAARQALIDAFETDPKPRIDNALYKQYKRALKRAFNGKCAYCECVIEANQPGDVEHYRPKGRVTDDEYRPIKVNYLKWGEIEHAGYFWLAYDWENLLPSCTDCNRKRNYEGGPAGKADRFPVKGFRACLPGEEAQEEPLLLDPTKADPNEHLEFFKDGTIRAKTPEGETTLAILGLNLREDLVRARRQAYDAAKLACEALVDAYVKDLREREEEFRPEVNNVWLGRTAYSAVGREALKSIRARLRRMGGDLPLPVPPPADVP
jgi:uncharacterized protein (TIGR02646 family)